MKLSPAPSREEMCCTMSRAMSCKIFPEQQDKSTFKKGKKKKIPNKKDSSWSTGGNSLQEHHTREPARRIWLRGKEPVRSEDLLR